MTCAFRWVQIALLFIVINVSSTELPRFVCQGERRGSCDAKGSYDMRDCRLSEDTAVGEYLYTLRAEDPDGGSVTYGLQADLNYMYFDLNSTSGEVFLKKEVDYEEFTELKVKWELTDSDDEKLVTQVTIRIKNVNDNDPVFSSPRYQFDSILENSVTSNDVIFDVTATDADSDTGIVYSTVDSYSDWPCNGAAFEIQRTSGNISLKVNEKLDFEDTSLYTICVQATDSGEPENQAKARYGYAQVIVVIQDGQDTAPVFAASNYNQEIMENKRVGYQVEQVQARDGDRGVLTPNGIFYKLLGGDGKFKIDNSTGWITIKETLDRETNTTHTVTVVAQEILADGSYEAPPSRKEIKIIFQVGDVDDEKAKFSSSSVNATLQENSLEGSFVPLNDLTVVDRDQTPNNEIVLSLGGPDADAFEIRNSRIIGQASVDVRVLKMDKMDFEKAQTLSFEINAANIAGNITDTVYVSITLQDENDETPKFSESTYTFNVTENSQGDFVGNIYAFDADSATFSQITYTLSGQGNKEQFQLNDASGEISTRDDAVLDYEGQSVYFITCVASDGQHSGTATIEIQLLDENDNSPQFIPANTYTAQVEENTIPTEPLLTVSAMDQDKGEMNKEIFFSLLNDSLSEMFSIDRMSGSLTLNEILDYERDGRVVSLTVIATDGGIIPRNASATIEVTIQDMNDNSPEFTQTFYSGYVSEESDRGEIVLRVSATDKDAPNSVNSRIDYFFDDISESDFRIGITSGNVTVNSVNLDRDERETYILKVIAIDRGEPPNRGSCNVSITLLDSNNKKPEFEEKQRTVQVSEDVAIGFNVTVVTASDRDETASLVYSIDLDGITAVRPDGSEISNDFSNRFTIGNVTGVIYIAEDLDRESESEFQLSITVEDVNGVVNTPQVDTLTLTIQVLDVNDNAPEFMQNNFEFTVPENAPVGYVISPSFSARDTDQGNNGQVQFDLADDVDSVLKIHPETGLLTVNGTLDREKYATYSATIVVKDRGTPSLASNETILLTITDVNDNAPEFDPELNTTKVIDEDYLSKMPILQVVAYDKDMSEEFGSIEYEITAGDPSGLFAINSTTGWIMIRNGKKLDRETEDEHILTISASDGSRQETIQVTIGVLDVNDNAPKFPNVTREISIQESVDINYLVTTVSATDEDELNTENTEIDYSISAGNYGEYFIIDTTSSEGQLRTNASLSNRVGKYVLYIVATDKGTPPLTSEPFKITVTVTDVNDNTPEILHPTNLADFLIPEDYTGFVLNVTAMDIDSGANGELDFKFIQSAGDTGKDSDFFKLNNIGQDSAQIFIEKKTDREVKAKYYLQVQVTDRGIERYSSSVSFTVSVRDSDDNEPLFWTKSQDRPKVKFSVFENNAFASLGSVNLATDADEPINQHIYYFIVDGNDEEQFVLNKTSGELSLQKALDRERNQTFRLVVKVTSNMTFTSLTSIPYEEDDNTLLDVPVAVLDENDNAPVFSAKNKLYTGGAKYSAKYLSEVMVVTAVDRDFDDNSKVVYKVTSQKYIDTAGNERAQNAFNIDPSTGSVFTLKTFSRGDEGYFTMKVEARDKLNPNFKDNATVSIYLYSEDQQVRMTLSKTPEEVRLTLDDFTTTIEEIIVEFGDFSQGKAKRQVSVTPEVVVDDIQTLTINGRAVQGQSVMDFHAVNIQDNTIIDPGIIVDAIDSAFDYTQLVRGVYGVNNIEFAAPTPVPPTDLNWFQWLLVAVVLTLLLALAALGMTYFFMRSRFQTQLRAATVYDSITPKSTKATNPPPNTNLYTKPGSNPLYGSNINEGFQNDYGEVPDEGEIEEKTDPIRNGHVAHADESPSEEQEIVLDMSDDWADDDEEVPDEETGDRMIMQLLQDHDKEKTSQYVTLEEFGNMTITEI